MVNLSVDCGLHSVKLDSLIQFEWPPWEFKLLCHSCLQHDHFIVLLILCVNIQSDYSFCSPITPFSWLIIINLWWDLCLVPRLLWHINSFDNRIRNSATKEKTQQKEMMWRRKMWQNKTCEKVCSGTMVGKIALRNIVGMRSSRFNSVCMYESIFLIQVISSYWHVPIE